MWAHIKQMKTKLPVEYEMGVGRQSLFPLDPLTAIYRGLQGNSKKPLVFKVPPLEITNEAPVTYKGQTFFLISLISSQVQEKQNKKKKSDKGRKSCHRGLRSGS